jgi:hypothetical protein
MTPPVTYDNAQTNGKSASTSFRDLPLAVTGPFGQIIFTSGAHFVSFPAPSSSFKLPVAKSALLTDGSNYKIRNVRLEGTNWVPSTPMPSGNRWRCWKSTGDRCRRENSRFAQTATSLYGGIATTCRVNPILTVDE